MSIEGMSLMMVEVQLLKSSFVATGLFKDRGTFDTPLFSVVGGPISNPFGVVDGISVVESIDSE